MRKTQLNCVSDAVAVRCRLLSSPTFKVYLFFRERAIGISHRKVHDSVGGGGGGNGKRKVFPRKLRLFVEEHGCYWGRDPSKT